MAEKGIYSPAIRKLGTIILFAAISGFFIFIYYLVYLPQQHALFNKRAFRSLHEIADNFTVRVSNYGTSYNNRVHIDPNISKQDFLSQPDSVFAQTFKASFTGNPETSNPTTSSIVLKQDSVIYHLTGATARDTSKLLSEILEPILSTHSRIFESVLLIKPALNVSVGEDAGVPDSILYKSAKTSISYIETDSILKSGFVQGPVLSEIEIGGISYKIFLLPFQIRSVSAETFVLAAMIPESSYRHQLQSIPVSFLISVGLVLIALLLSLPFLKIFVLSFHENINIADIRFIIAVIFIIPFVVSLACSAVWLYKYPKNFTDGVLSSLQNQITANLLNEVNLTIQQAKEYNRLMEDPKGVLQERNKADSNYFKRVSAAGEQDFKDVIFYPTFNKNIENVHWMNEDGNDVAAWNFTKKRASYFQLKDRVYFRNIKYKRKYLVPGIEDTFSIQPTLSRLTGEYTITIAIPANITISPERKAIAIGLSSKMYSIYNTVVPDGYGYCLIDSNGLIVSHSDTARSLQENLFEETNNNHDLHTAINHKDNMVIGDVTLYDQSVKMMVKPMPGLPYYLVTYYEKRSKHLFIFHIVAFVFVCQSILLLLVSLFSYCMMLPEKRISKAFFSPGTHNWLKPSGSKQKYYIKNCIQLVISIFFVFFFSLFIDPANRYIYKINCAVLLPLFAVTGYYIIKKSRTFLSFYKRENVARPFIVFSRKQLGGFFGSIRNILIIYVFSIIIYAILQDEVFYNKLCPDNTSVKPLVWSLIFLLPLFSCLVAGSRFHVVSNRSFRGLKRFAAINNIRKDKSATNTSYLTYFIISLLLTVAVISVIPAITFTSYALHEERKLNLQSFQIEMARKIQQRRVEINNKLRQTKLSDLYDTDAEYSNNFKFEKEKGLYLYNHSLVRENFLADASAGISCSLFYKLITRFLFLPPDHDEFYDNPSHNNFYYWQQSENEDDDKLTLHYRNVTDNRDPSSISISGEILHFSFPQHVFHDNIGLLILIGILGFIFLFYKLIYAVSKRVYLIGFFDEFSKKHSITADKRPEESGNLKTRFGSIDLRNAAKILSVNEAAITFSAIRARENELLKDERDSGESIVKLHIALKPVYEKIWQYDCSDVEKYTLYNFALDGFTNYKKGIVLYKLLNKGLMIKEDDNFTLMTKSFRNFLITKEKSEEIERLAKQEKGSWAAVRTFFLIVLLAVAVFIFISQEEATKRIITIVTSVGALLPLILKLFDKSSRSASSGAKTGR